MSNNNDLSRNPVQDNHGFTLTLTELLEDIQRDEAIPDVPKHISSKSVVEKLAAILFSKEADAQEHPARAFRFLGSYDELKVAIQSGMSLQGAAIDVKDLRVADLRKKDLRGSTFLKPDFTNASLEGADLRDTVFLSATFKNCNLTSANLIRARLPSHQISLRSITGVLFDEADLQDCFLDIRRIDQSSFQGASLLGTLLEDSKFRQSVFTRADLTLARLLRCDFTKSVLQNSILRGARLQQVSIDDCDVRFADFCEVGWVRGKIENSAARFCDFNHARIDGVTFNAVDLTASSFADHAEVRNCTFQSCDLSGCDFGACEFVNCQFIRCDFSRTRWNEGNVEQVRISRPINLDLLDAPEEVRQAMAQREQLMLPSPDRENEVGLPVQTQRRETSRSVGKRRGS